MGVEQLNKKFVKGAVLKADELNDMVAKTNEIIGAMDDKIGATYFDVSTMRQLQFRSVEDRDAWLNGGGDTLILRADQFSFSGTVNQVRVTDEYGTKNLFFTTSSERADITVGFISQTKGIADSSWEEVYEDFIVTVGVDKGASGNYTYIITDKLVKNGDTFTFDVKKYLASGNNRVRITAVGSETGEIGTSIYTVNLTSMYISPSNFAWYKPFIEGTDFSLGGMNIGGNLSKKVIVKVTNDTLNYSATYEDNIGMATYITSAYFFRKMTFPTTGTGTYQVEIWLDANGLESEHLFYNIMCITSEEQFTASEICINDVSRATNGVDSTLFSFSVYNKGQATASPTFKIEKDGEIVQEETLQSIATSALQKYSASLEFEDERTSFDINITGMLEDARQYVTVNVDNSASFPAVTGAGFYLNPAKRNNAQDNKEVIINEINGGIHNVTWTNMAWVDGTDGWTTDNDGRKCLLIPATCKGVVNYQPLATQGSGKTIEIAYKVSNAADYGENIITSALNPTASNFQGIVIKPKKVMVHSRDLYVNDDAQSYPTKDEEMVHLVITIVKNYKTNYGNICIIYVNGVKKCSFEFTNTDSFANSASLYLGSETADLYIYKMRVYESGFGWQDAVQNYINCLPTQVDKIASWTKINAILDDSYKVDYDAVYGKYNTMVIEMKGNGVIPNLLQPAGGYCDLWINIINPKEGELDEDFASLFNGSLIEEQQIEGQGTTAMTYYRWNFRWKLTSVYNKRRITAKKNVASSMQDHKMGATRMFNDLHNSIVGENEANARVAVFQYPVYGFERTLVEGTEDEYVYTFIGLYTIGPDKGDKTTFGYNDERFETTVMHLEGTDHTPTSVGMEYPWNETRYDASREAMGAILGNSIDAAWEVGAAGELEPDSASDQDGVQAMLDTEFKPAYEVAYFNSTFIEGVSESLEEINANIETWRANKNANGVSYSTLEFWTDGVYDLYYYNVSEKIYKPTGVNMLTDLGLSSGDVSGKTIAEKNELFKQKRRERFASEMGNYWHKDDAVFHYTFCMMFAATDNFKKNSYPYKFSSLADGGRWCWRQDDLDTLFDINNQGFSAKLYSVLVGDQTSTGSGSVYRGDNSVFWTLIKECFKEEIKSMVHRIMDKMAELSPYGQNNLERIVGYVRSCCWDMAQDYFAKSGYNEDAEWTYEEAWYLRNQGKYNNDVHPLQQSLGSHYEAERDWVELRMVFLASYFQYGAFATDHGDDTSTGQISFRSTSGKTYTITPALDFNPTILIGQSALVSAEDRIKAGQSVDVVVPDMGSNDTHIYIQGADYYSDLGNLADISTSADNPVLNVSSKRLRRLKVGDELASNVTSNVKTLTVGACPSMESVDARNLKSLVGAVDLTKCPRLKEALFGGTSATSISIPVGSKIVKLSLPDTLTTLSLVRLLNLTEENLSYGTMANLAYVRIESNNKMDGFEVLKTAYENSPELKNIRIVGFEYDGDGSDITMIANFATAVDENGNRIYSGIDDEGNITTGLPVLDGSLSINTPAYESDVKVVNTYYPSLAISVPEFYIPFVDEVVKRLCATNFGDGIGLTSSKAATITSLGSVFRGNTTITSFNELEEFTGLTSIASSAFNGSSISELTLPVNLKTIFGNAFYNTTNLSSFESIKNIEQVTIMYVEAFRGSTIGGEVYLPNLTSLGSAAFQETSIIGVENLGYLTTLFTYVFSRCYKLLSVKLSSTITSIQEQAFGECRCLRYLQIDATTPPALDTNVFYRTYTEIYVPDESLSDYKAATNWNSIEKQIKPISLTKHDFKEVNLSNYTILHTAISYDFANNKIASIDNSSNTTDACIIPVQAGEIYKVRSYIDGTTITVGALVDNQIPANGSGMDAFYLLAPTSAVTYGNGFDSIITIPEGYNYLYVASRNNQTSQGYELKVWKATIILVKSIEKGASISFDDNGMFISKRADRAILIPIGQYLAVGSKYKFTMGSKYGSYFYGVQIMKVPKPGLTFEYDVESAEQNTYFNEVSSRMVDTGWLNKDYIYECTTNNEILCVNFRLVSNGNLNDVYCEEIKNNFKIEIIND